MIKDGVIPLNYWQAIEYEWGNAVIDKNDKVIEVYLKPDGQKINVEHLNVLLHENGIEFL